jgi:CRP-like cAMP-binding protein
VTAEQLRAFPALGSHSAEDLELLAYMATLRKFARGETMIRPGAEGEAAFLILDGSVEVSRANMPLATLEAGTLVGHLALLDPALRSSTVIAVTEATALELKADVFSNLVKSSSPLALRFQREVATAAARHLRAASELFAAMSGEGSNRLALHDIDVDGLNDEWSTSDSDEPIELDVDPDAQRH